MLRSVGAYELLVRSTRRLFVLTCGVTVSFSRPIEDPEQRRLLQADFHLVDMSADNCLEVEPRGLNAQDPGVTHQHTERGDVYCFAVDDKGG